MKDRLLQMLSLPFEGELNLTIPDKTIERVIIDQVKGQLEITEFHCFDGFFSFYAKKGILPRMNIHLGIDEVTLNRTQCILLLSDKKGNLFKLIDNIGRVGIQLPLKPYRDNLMYLGLSSAWMQNKSHQPMEIDALLDALKVIIEIIPAHTKLNLITHHV